MTIPPPLDPRGIVDLLAGYQDDELVTAAEHGRICALAAGGQRDLQSSADAYPDLFPAHPFDPAMFSTLALAVAFTNPWCTREQLRVANRAALWVSAVDWQIDYVATSRAAVEAIVAACLSIADDSPPDVDMSLTRLLAEMRDDLTRTSRFAEFRPIWREELQRMLGGKAREWEWKSAHAADADGRCSPSFEEYLSDADNHGSSFISVSHWLFTSERTSLDHVAELIRASRAVQSVQRLINDLATHQREVQWGDVNALMLGASHAHVAEHLTLLLQHCRQLLSTLTNSCPKEAAFLARSIGFCSGFYEVIDFWGSL